MKKDRAKAILDAADESGVPVASLVPVAPSGRLAVATPPQAKPKKNGPARRTVVKRVTDERSGITVDVVLDAQTGLFEAKVPGYPTTILGPDFATVVAETERILRAAQEYQWKPSIVVDVGRDGGFWAEDRPGRPNDDVRHTHLQRGGCVVDVTEAALAMRYYRVEIAPKPGDPARFVCRPHMEDVEAEDAGKESWVPKHATLHREKGHDVGDFLERSSAVVMPYTPELWAAVEQAAEDVLAVGKRLRELVKRPDLLAKVGSRLLLASAPDTIPALPAPDQEGEA